MSRISFEDVMGCLLVHKDDARRGPGSTRATSSGSLLRARWPAAVGLDAEALGPPVDLLAVLSEVARDAGDVAAELFEHQAQALGVGHGVRRHTHAQGGGRRVRRSAPGAG